MAGFRAWGFDGPSSSGASTRLSRSGACLGSRVLQGSRLAEGNVEVRGLGLGPGRFT